jgi:hypothetical protein
MSTLFGPIMQHGYIVSDVRKTAADWAERLGVGPFYVLDRVGMDQYYFRGRRVDVELCLGFGYWHGMQIELIQPLDEADTLYRRALHSSAGRLNHVASIVSDLDGLLASRGLQERVIQRGDMASGLKFVYLEEFVPGGLHLELVQAQESTLMAFAGMEKAARHWDGRNAVRPMSALGEDLAALPAGH